MIRNYLSELDEAGFTKNLGRKGREITNKGLGELRSAIAIDKVGFVSVRIDELAYSMTLNLSQQTGTVVINVSIINSSSLQIAAELMKEVMDAKLSMGRKIALIESGSSIGEIKIPEGKIGIGTVCSITLNGALMKAGVPIVSRFGGLLECRGWKPYRIIHMISYDGTTLDPLEIFIRSKMTNIVDAARNGNGIVGASFREAPAAALPTIFNVVKQLDENGLGGVLAIGEPNQPLLDIPVRYGSVGIIVAAGLNPSVTFEESGIITHNTAMASLYNFQNLIPIEETCLKSSRKTFVLKE